VPTRREFLRQSSLLAATLAAGRVAFARQDGAAPKPAPAAAPPVAKAAKPLKLLILGGTGFLGPCVVRRAVARGHSMTLFNRGKTDPAAFPELERLRGDRSTGDLKALEGREWDAVVDTSGYVPTVVGESASLLADHVNQYVFVSTISVYAQFDEPGLDEGAPLAQVPANVDPAPMRSLSNLGLYGALKAKCEQAVEKEMPGRVTNIRPGLIVGPDDETDRFTYWPVRVADGGEVLAPGTPADPVQFIDVRDLADFIVLCIEKATVGVMNATGPKGGLPVGKMLEACKEAAKSDATFTWAPDEFLDANKISGWSDLPVWISPRQPGGGLTALSVERAVKAGLVFRSPVETARDTLEWYRASKRKSNFPMTRQRESAALAALHEKQKSGGGPKKS
jgi:2'-hydroxyisoflavone reductase